MKRHKHRAHSPRKARPARAAGSGWGIGPRPSGHTHSATTESTAATIELNFPIETSAGTCSSIELRRPTTADVLWFRKQSGNKRVIMADFARRLADITEVDFSQLDSVDVFALAEACNTLIDEM